MNQVRQRQQEKHELDTELAHWAREEFYKEKAKLSTAVQDRQREQSERAYQKAMEKKQLIEEQARERELIDQKNASITRAEHDRREALRRERDRLREDFLQAVEAKEAANRSGANQRRVREASLRTQGTTTIVQDLLEEQDLLRAKKAAEMSLRRQELHGRAQEQARQRELEEEQRKLERLSFEDTLNQMQKERLQRIHWQLGETQRLKFEMENKQKLVHDEQRQNRSPEARSQNQELPAWFRRPPSPKLRRGRFIPAGAYLNLSSIY